MRGVLSHVYIVSVENGYGFAGAGHDKSVRPGGRLRPRTGETIATGGALAI